MPTDEIEITELAEFEPDRVDGVKSAANGFPILMLKSLDGEITETEGTVTDVLAELDKADGKCDMCHGNGKMDDAKCKKCLGSGLMPKIGMSEKELLEAAKEAGVAASGQPVPLPDECPNCNGTGSHEGMPCEECVGTGRVGSMPSAEEQSTRQGFEGKVSEGDPQGREKIDKSSDEDDEWLVDQIQFEDNELDLEKAKLKAKQRRALPKSAFAIPEKAPGSGSYPIPDESHARNALARVSQFGTPEEKSRVRAAVRRRYPNIEMDKAMDGSMFSGANPQLAAVTSDASDDNSDDNASSMPGSPAWEAVDATMATEAALALMAAGELIRNFAQREAIEVAAGEGNDIFDTFEAEQAMCDVSHALGIIASLAFHEGLEAAKSLDDDVEKAGKRLSGKSITKISSTRDNAKQLADHLTELLGDDDPAKKSDDGPGMSASEKFIANANKAALAKEIESMSTDQLEKVLDARDEKLVGLMSAAIAEGLATAEASKGTAAMDEAASVADAKVAHRRAKAKNPKGDDMDLEDEADQGDHDSANTSPTGSAKALEDMSPEELAAHEQFEAAKALMKEAKKAQKQAARDAEVAKEIREGIEEATKAFETLQARLGTVDDLKERLSVVEKNVVPGGPARTAPPEAAVKSRQRDEIEFEVARLDGLARNATDREVRKAYEDRARDELAKLATLGV